MSDGGKGSRPRPYSVTQKEYDSRWDAIFGRDSKKEEPSSDTKTDDKESDSKINESK
jgi:hypothetical protein